jgi:exonuclease SbcC
VRERESVLQQMGALKTVKDNLEQEIPRLEQEDNSAMERLELAEKGLTLAREKTQFEREKLSFEEQRRMLAEGYPCPLCGATHHPFNSEEPNPLANPETEETALEGQVKNLRQEQSAKAGSLRDARQKLIRSIAENETLVNRLEENTRLVSGLTLPAGCDPSGTYETINKQYLEYKNLVGQLQAYRDACTGIDIVNVFVQARVKWEQADEEKRQLVDSRDLIYAGNDINREVTQITTGLATTSETILRCERESGIVSQARLALVKELAISAKSMQKDLLKHGFASIEVVKAALLDEVQEEVIRKIGIELEKQISDNSQSLVAYRNTLGELTVQRKIEGTYDDLSGQQKTVAKEHSTISSNLLEKQIQLRNQQAGRLRFNQLESELATRKSNFSYYQVLKDLVGDRDGKRFNIIVQRFTLRHLLGLANHRLSGLTERYRLMLREQQETLTDKSLDKLMISDLYQGGQQRGVETLSGGESFLVSMALALGLSDLAARNIRIGSLFIDEGFGSLDPDTLDMAISTLEKLQAEDGKTIGIISHVDTLKERIVCQVKVNKGASGYSTIEVQ